MKKKPVILALLQSALVVTLLVGAPLAADAISDAQDNKMNRQPSPAQIPPKDDTMSRPGASFDPNNPAMKEPDRVVSKTDRDSALEERVEKTLEPYNVKVDAEEGIVRLTGTVDTMQQRDAIIQQTRGVGGVQSVESYLRVKGAE